MKSKNLLTLFACFVLIITTFINVSIHKKQSSVLGQTISYCQKIGGYCTNSCTPSSTLRCLAGTALGCKTVYCAQRVTSYPTPTLAYYTPIKPSPTINYTYPSLTPTRSPTTYIPTPTNVGSTYPSLGYIPCYEIQRVYTQFCQSTYPTFTPTPSPRLLTMTPVPSSTRYPTNTPTRSPTSTPTLTCKNYGYQCSSNNECCSGYCNAFYWGRYCDNQSNPIPTPAPPGECYPNQFRCVDVKYQYCNNTGTAWGPILDCGFGQECRSGNDGDSCYYLPGYPTPTPAAP